MYRACRLPFSFDSHALLADLAVALRAASWAPHFVPRNYDGDWSGIPLRSVGGRADHLVSDPCVAPEGYDDTPLMADCAYFREVLANFRCPLTSVRLLKLAAGSRIKEHTDLDLSAERGVARLHIPITTNPDVAIYIEDERVTMAPGECWYIDATLRHRLNNFGASDRIHIVFDCIVNDWLGGLLHDAGLRPRPRDFYELRGIRSKDVDKVIAAFRAQGTEDGMKHAAELEAAHAEFLAACQ